MKSILSTIALATLVAIASLSQTVHAQNLAARVVVPFAFDCGAQHFDAGTYTIGIYNNVALMLSDSNRHTRFVIFVNYHARSDSGSPNAPASVTFRKYGNTYFLAEYSTSGTTITLLESNKERRVAREYAMSQTASGLVQVAALGK